MLHKRTELGVLAQCVRSEGEGGNQGDLPLPHHPSEMQLSAFLLIFFSLLFFSPQTEPQTM